MEKQKRVFSQIELSKLITSVENGEIDIEKLKAEKNGSDNPSFVIGITGPPGVGKSTIINLLIKEFRESNKKVGVIAIDPTSILTGGALLGDRIRMRFNSDDDVFIRSLATRGKLGGLGENTRDIVELFKLAGFEIIIVETVGVGQTETDIMKISDIIVTITSPAHGDEIQMMKAGILELSDIIILNKSDFKGSETVYKNLVRMAEILPRKRWKIPVIKMVAKEKKGFDVFYNALIKYRENITEKKDE
jgi:LAO/AO transport system kinase